MEAITIAIHLITAKFNQIVDENHIEEFVELLEAGRRLPPITVKALGDSRYQIVDGRHRLEAHKRLALSTIRARITR